MPRVKKGVPSRARRKRMLARAKGYRGLRNNTYKLAKETVERGQVFAYRDRRVKKRNFRELWIVRINAAARMFGLSYSVFTSGLKKAGIEINRQMLSELAINDIKAFEVLATAAKSSK